MFNSNQAFLLVQNLKSATHGFALGVKADVQLKSSIPIGAKLETNPPPFGCSTLLLTLS
jgi:hypothetical protein